MSGTTEVRLYRNTVDEVPAEYTDITSAVLNSGTTDHAAGIERYLGGVAKVGGLDFDTTYYFWVELVDARGNTAGPQPAGSHTTPWRGVKWEFFVAHASNNRQIHLFGVSSDFGVTPENLRLAPGWSAAWDPEEPSVALEQRTSDSDNDYRVVLGGADAGRTLFTVYDFAGSQSAQFRVKWSRKKYMPGVGIRRNGVTVYQNTSNAGSSHYSFREWRNYTITDSD
jgi:hypothetical protein